MSGWVAWGGRKEGLHVWVGGWVGWAHLPVMESGMMGMRWGQVLCIGWVGGWVVSGLID